MADAGPKRKAKVAKKVLCITCGRDLRQSFAYAAHGWKACPECSHKNGKQHVLRPYPAAFEAARTQRRDRARRLRRTPAGA